MPDKQKEALLDGLRLALGAAAEARLFRSGKLPGLFPTRTGATGDAAAQAVRDGFLDVVRREEKGKLRVEWVRLTPAGVRHLHDQESPLKALEDLRDLLQATQAGIPAWMADMRGRLAALETALRDDAARVQNQLRALGERVESGLRQLQAKEASLPDGLAVDLPWAGEALQYLDQRRTAGAGDACSLPELFADLAARHPALGLADFHSGVRRLHHARALRLLPAEEGHQPARPEFALLEGDRLYYRATR
jgi:DNA-binding PadR family transcriptional regulator